MNKISNSQLFAVLLCTRAFGLICSRTSPNASHMAGAVISIAVQFLAAIPMLMLYRHSGFSLQKEMLFGKAGKLLYALFFIAEGAFAFNQLWGVSTSVYFPVDSSLACAVILAAVCLYCASMKLSTLNRSSLIVAGIFLFSLLILILGAYSKADPKNYVPNASFNSIMDAAISSFCSSGELAALFILLDFSSENNRKGVTAFFISSLLLTELIYIIEITVLGNISSMTDFPFFTAGAFSQPFSIQRADSLYMITFTLLCVLTVTLRLALTSILLKEVIPDLKYNTLLSVILMLCLSALLNSSGMDISPIMGILTIILSVIIPIIMLIRRIYSEKNTNGGNADSTALRMQP